MSTKKPLLNHLGLALRHNFHIAPIAMIFTLNLWFKIPQLSKGQRYILGPSEHTEKIEIQSDLVNPPPMVPSLFLAGLEKAGLAIGSCTWIQRYEVQSN